MIFSSKITRIKIKWSNPKSVGNESNHHFLRLPKFSGWFLPLQPITRSQIPTLPTGGCMDGTWCRPWMGPGGWEGVSCWERFEKDQPLGWHEPWNPDWFMTFWDPWFIIIPIELGSIIPFIKLSTRVLNAAQVGKSSNKKKGGQEIPNKNFQRLFFLFEKNGAKRIPKTSKRLLFQNTFFLSDFGTRDLP